MLAFAVLYRNGAPIAYKTTNILVRDLFPSNHSLQDVFAADNPSRLVTDLDGTDHGTDIGLTSVDPTIFELVGHQSCKHVDLFRVDGYTAKIPLDRIQFGC